MQLKHLTLCIACGLLTTAAAAQTAAAPFKTPLEATSYAVGADMVRNFKAQDVSFDLEAVVRGLRDAASGGKLLMADAEIKRQVGELEQEVRRKMTATRKLDAESNQKKSDAFFAANAKQPGVVTLPSGLQYSIVKEGHGARATADMTVLAHYKGQLLDGTAFDATEPGKPASFKLAGVIAGWREAMLLMPVGSSWQLFIPAQLAYGERGAGRLIGPNQALRFDVELVEAK
jgi:FKBP-type peptidyl-prolyl cis-trans isomerase FklB